MLTTANQAVLWDFLRERVGIPWSSDLICIGRVENNELVGVVGFHNFTGTSCHMHMAGDGGRWINKQFIRAAFGYVFEILNLTMVFGIVPSGNIRALGIDRRLGFEELLYIPGAHPDGGIHILQMKREQCRWLRKPDGKEVDPQSA